MAGQKSKVWLHFTKNNCEDNEGASCNKCQVIVKYKQGSTTNLHKHLKRHHSVELESKSVHDAGSDGKKKKNEGDTDKAPTTTLTSLWTKLPNSSPRHKNISNAIAKYIALDMRPLNCVNDRGFEQLLATLEPRYSMESRTHITEKLIPKLYTDLRAKVQKNISKATFTSLTTDAWTSRGTKSFNTVTAQYINEDWQWVNNVLVTREMVESHTADNLAAEF